MSDRERVTITSGMDPNDGCPLNLILDYCNFSQIDIERAILLKHKYNITRPYRHGGKKC